MFKILRQEHESVFKLKGLCPDKKLPQGLLIEGSEAIRNALSASDIFENAKRADQENESIQISQGKKELPKLNLKQLSSEN